jgi:murein DD-endopeptidase MepM/ murein hydrolase activator NlpD
MNCAPLRGIVAAILISSATAAIAEEITLNDPAIMLCDTSATAVFSAENGTLHPSRGFFSLYPPGATALVPRIAAPEDSAPGSLVRVYVSSSNALDNVSLVFKALDGRALARATGFRIAVERAQETWVLLLGVPSDVERRSGTLSIRMSAGSRSCMLLQPLTLRERHFFSERIGLTKDLTDLVTSPDARKTAESRVLTRILFSPHVDAIFETGAFLVPIPGARRSAGFGDRREYDYSDKTSDLSIHQGVDLAAPEGSDVPACGRGRVVFSGMRILTGNSVVIEHLPGVFSLYYHMSQILVKLGDTVEKGQVIGKVGMTGFATGPHLHWEVRVMGVAVDPDSLAAAPLLDKEPDFRDIEGRDSAEGR